MVDNVNGIRMGDVVRAVEQCFRSNHRLSSSRIDRYEVFDAMAPALLHNWMEFIPTMDPDNEEMSDDDQDEDEETDNEEEA